MLQYLSALTCKLRYLNSFSGWGLGIYQKHYAGIHLRQDAMFRSFFTILISGMGNVKQGNWKSSSVYFGFLVLLGAGLYYLEQQFIQPYFYPSQTMRTFLVLLFIAFAFFWDGTGLLKYKSRNNFFNQENRVKEDNKEEENNPYDSSSVDHSRKI